MLTELSMSFSTLCYNIVIIKRIGEIGVTAYSIVLYVISIIVMILMGITMGIQPIISYNYGAKEFFF
jgi:Na+-driven multidrug efflux pump